MVRAGLTAWMLSCTLAACGRADDAPSREAPAPRPAAPARTHLEPQARPGVPAASRPAPAASATAAASSPRRPTTTAEWPPGRYPQTAPGDRIYSKVRHLWIRPSASSTGWIGYLSLGDSVRVKGGDRERALVVMGGGHTCNAWYAVEPVGVVCAGANATFDPNDPVIAELVKHKADAGSPYPYQYGESLNAPVYPAPPSKYQQRTREVDYRPHLAKVERARAAKSDAELAAIDPSFAGMAPRHDVGAPAGKGPPRLLDLPPAGRILSSRIVNGSTVAYTDAFDHEGRTFLLTWDRGIVPKDKVRPYPEVTFHGVVLGQGVALPIAFFRGKAGPKYDASLAATGQSYPRLSWVGLTGKTRGQGEQRFHETRDTGIWVLDRDVTIARRVKELPLAVRQKRGGRRSWLDISIMGGTLVAYEYDTPVYATLVSPGRGGLPHGKIPTLETASTPTGIFHVLGKFVTATMVSGSVSTLVHAEVPYTMNFSGPYALHGAYWHDAWGERKSGGCVNLSPVDARRIFSWTDPPLPHGWHGLRTIEMKDRGLTLVHIHE